MQAKDSFLDTNKIKSGPTEKRAFSKKIKKVHWSNRSKIVL